MNAPDPQRLGGLAWVRRTGGRLSSAERRRLLLEVGVGQWVNAVGRVKLALGRIPDAAAHVDIDTFRVPDSKFAREAEEACVELPSTLQGHSYRTWLFGRALAIVDGNTIDDELFYAGRCCTTMASSVPRPTAISLSAASTGCVPARVLRM